MRSLGALGQPATVLSPSLVTSLAHPCPLSSPQRWAALADGAAMGLRAGGSLDGLGVDELQTKQRPSERGYAGTGCCSTPEA